MHLDPTLLNIGQDKQIFVDDLIIESAENVCRTWHEPEKCEHSPVLFKDRPWEKIPYFTCNSWQVIRDPKDGLFKCWYTDWNKPEIRPEDTAMGKSVFHILYAESEDGLNWRKPDLDVFPMDGHKTNVVIPNSYNLGLVLDPHEEDVSRRFKGVYTSFTPGTRDVAAVVAASSGDGIHWTQANMPPVLGRSGARLDDVIILHYEPLGRLFVLNTRHYDMYAVARNLQNPTVGHWCPPYYPLDWRRMNKRRIWQSESSDLLHWSEPYPVLVPEDGLDDLDETFYGLCQYQVGPVTLGLLNTYSYVPNTMNVRLVYSRNGKTWQHLNKRRPFIRPGGEGCWDAYMVTIPSKPIEVGNELYVYHGGSCAHHDWWVTGAREGLEVPEATDVSRVHYSLGLSKLRLDGFVSLDAGPARRGVVVTRPVISGGRKLIVNARCRTNGAISAEMVDIRDEVIPGYSVQDCDVFTGDSTHHVFSWKGQSQLPPVTDERAEYPKAESARFRKVRFYMEKAELYSFALA